MAKLTVRTIKSAKPGDRDIYIWDEKLSGFGLRVKPSGVKSFLIQYRNAHNVSKRLTVGRFGVISPEQARTKAERLLADVSDGVDPSKDKQEARKAPTIGELAIRYMAEYATPRKKPSGAEQDQRNIRCHILPALRKNRKAADITRQDVMKMMNGLKDTPGAANRARAVLSKMMELAEVWDVRPANSNPCRHVKKYPETKRERFLNADEFCRLGETLAEAERQNVEPPHAIAAFRLLIFTGCRRGEILSLRWSDVDWDHQCLRLTDSKTGPKVVHLNAPALELLQNIERKEGSPWVIPGRKLGEHLVDVKGPWRRIREKAGLEGLRIHDLRHSFASIGAVGGVPLQMVGTLLGHTQASTTERYSHLAPDPLKAANEMIGERIAAAMLGENGEVIEFGKR
ncbi:MAG: tyrosine-type recombinase/integrase [Rhodospirillales bacterium]|nr:tyrosine-type recombinase/integrase [Rhodospirillales bacterium]